jgi:hypothetical protein
MNIYEKITAVMQDVQYLAKDDHVKFGTTDYKALSEEKVTVTMRAELLKHGLVVFPVEQTANRAGSITHVDVKYRIVNVENPDEYIEVVSCGDGADTQDKGSGKAMTYAYKYMWLRTFALPTGEDPDKISTAELEDRARQNAESESVCLCENCGKQIAPVKKRDGEMWSAKDMVTYSKLKYKKALCGPCMKIEDKKL